MFVGASRQGPSDDPENPADRQSVDEAMTEVRQEGDEMTGLRRYERSLPVETDSTVTPEEVGRLSQRREVAAEVERLLPHLDNGIRRYVEVLRLAGVETYESCQGGPDPERRERGHAYSEPTVRFHGTQGAGWWALQVCLDHGFPVQSLSRIWTVEEREPHGPTWQLVFTEGTADDPR